MKENSQVDEANKEQARKQALFKPQKRAQLPGHK